MFPSVQVMGLARNGRQAGTAASLLGAATFGFAGLITPVVGLVGVACHQHGHHHGRLQFCWPWPPCGSLCGPRTVPKI